MTNTFTEVIETKTKFLLTYNPSKITNENQTEILQEFIDCIETLLGLLQDKNDQLTDSSRLLLTDALSICMLRSTQVIKSKKIDSETYLRKIETIFDEDKSSFILQYILDYWIDGGSSLTNALTDLFNKFLVILNTVFKNDQSNKFLSEWLIKIMDISSSIPIRSQYQLINALAPKMNLFFIISRKPDFIDHSLSLISSASLNNLVGKCLAHFLINIFEQHFHKDPALFDEWLSIWRMPMLKYLEDEEYTESITLHLLTPIFKHFTKEEYTKFVSCQEISTNPRLLLSLLRTGQKSGVISEALGLIDGFNFTVADQLFKDYDLKLQVFEVVTFSNAKSKDIDFNTLNLVFSNLRVFFFDERTEVRTHFLISLRRFLLRLRDSTLGLIRGLNKMNVLEQADSRQRERFSIYLQTMEGLVHSLVNEIEPLSAYSNKQLALDIYIFLTKLGFDSDVPLKYIDTHNRDLLPFSVSLYKDPLVIRYWTNILIGSFPDLREKASYLLKVQFETHQDIALHLRDVMDFTSMSRKAERELANYQRCEYWASFSSFIFTVEERRLDLLKSYQDNLLNEIKSCTEDYSRNLGNKLGGYFATITKMLTNFPENFDPSYRDECVQLGIIYNRDCWSFLKEIVCHDASESLLPTKYLDAEVSDQYIISYAFKAVKESSAMLNVLLSSFDISNSQLDIIGKFLIEQLTTLKHSGAFQAVLPTFRSWCIKCRKDNPIKLDTYLEEIIDSIQERKKHITRRSGGLPFLITIILGTETDKGRPQLKITFGKLKSIALLPITEHQDKLDLPQVNAINCIRAIFIESKLADVCLPYIEQAAELALKFFTSPIWAMRNCSIMLFTSLQNRMFGKSDKKMNARLFFTKYPGLRGILLETFKVSMDETLQEDGIEGTKVEIVFLVLNILLRLEPTAGYTGLDVFMEYVVACLSNKNWKIRDIAARSLSSMTVNAFEQMEKLCMGITLSNQNKLHGCLLGMYYFITENIELQSQQDHCKHFLSILLDRLPEIVADTKDFVINNKCYVTVKAYLELVHEFLKHINNAEATKYLKLREVLNYYFTKENKLFTLDGSKQLCLAKVFELLLIYEVEDNIVGTYLSGLNSRFYEVQRIALEYLLTKAEPTVLKDTLVDAITKIFNNHDMLPVLKTLSFKFLSTYHRNLPQKKILECISGKSNTDLKLVAIEALGVSCDPSLFRNSVWETIRVYSKDDTPIDFRFAYLRCITVQYLKQKSPGLMLEIFRMTYDDDCDIRMFASNFIQKNLYNRTDLDSNIDPFFTAQDFTQYFTKEFHDSVTEELLLNMLKEFLMSYNLLEWDVEAPNELFEVEKDNQYRNDGMFYGKCVTILGAINAERSTKKVHLQRIIKEFELAFNNKIDEAKRLTEFYQNSNVISRVKVYWLMLNLNEKLALNP